MRSLSLITAILAALPVPLFAQDNPAPQRSPIGGERLLRQAFLELSPSGSSDTCSVLLTYGARAMTATERKRTLEKGRRWHIGGDAWPVLQTTHPLRFDVGDDDDERLAERFTLPAGRYVLSAQVGEHRRQLVLTRADVVERLRLRAARPDELVGLGGTYVPVEWFDQEHATANPIVRLEADEYGGCSANLSIRVGNYELRADFTALESKQRKGTPKDVRLDTLLGRLGVGAPVRHALLDTIGRIELLSLAPDSLEDEAPGDRFHGYRVLGRKLLNLADDGSRATASTLQRLLRESILAHPDETVADCFEPRHGLRITSAGAPIDLVICFTCEQVQAFRGGNPIEGCYVVKTWEPQFSDCYRALGLPIAQ